MASQESSGRAAARARRATQIQGKGAPRAPDRSRAPAQPAPPAAASPPVPAQPGPKGGASGCGARAASIARREALADRGKVAIARPEPQRGDVVRARAKRAAGQEPATPPPAAASSPTRSPTKPVVKPTPGAPAPGQSAGRLLAQARRHAIASAGKRGTEVHRTGPVAAQVARQVNPGISGRDMSRVVREERSRNGRSGAGKSPPTGRRRPQRATSDATSGTQVGPGGRETGAEAGLCRDITGTRYLSGEVFDRFCQDGPPAAPRKVADLRTLSGGAVTGTSIAGTASVTGAEAGRCRAVTGDEYLGGDHFAAVCDTAPAPPPRVTGLTETDGGQTVSGTRVQGGARVTGTEAGAKRSLTGTPYVGAAVACAAPTPAPIPVPAPAPIVGPVGGPVGARPGVTGTRGEGARISGTFSRGAGKVTGTEDHSGEIDRARPVGPRPAMAMAFRRPSERAPMQVPVQAPVPVPPNIVFDTPPPPRAPSAATGALPVTEDSQPAPAIPDAMPDPAPGQDGTARARITGEGLDRGQRITGDDWDRGDRVTGTEGHSASARNPTWRGSAMPTPPAHQATPRSTPRASEFLVTGSSGNTTQGARVTVSGGARG